MIRMAKDASYRVAKKFFMVKSSVDVFHLLLADLPKLVRDYDPERAKFSTYLYKYAETNLTRYFLKYKYLVQPPTSILSQKGINKLHPNLQRKIEHLKASIVATDSVDEKTFSTKPVAENTAMLKEALNKLPTEAREVIEGRYFGGMSLQDLADKYSVTLIGARKIELEILREMRDGTKGWKEVLGAIAQFRRDYRRKQ